MRSPPENARFIRLGFTFLAALVPCAGWADDWPQWRGPTKDAAWHERGIVEKFPPEGLKVLWHAEAGWGWSSPVVAEGRVFFSDSVVRDKKAGERVRCFDAATGKVLWTYAYDVDYPDWAFNAEQNGGPVSSPAVVNGTVYALGSNGQTMCLDAGTGELLWRKDLAKDYAVEAFTCCRGSPLIDGDLLILSIGAKPGPCILALNRHTGRKVWKALEERVSNSTPIIIAAGGTRQLIVWTGQSVTSLDPTTGATFWREPVTTSRNDNSVAPVWSGDRLLISGLMFKLDHDKPAATVVWPEKQGASKRILSNTTTPMIAGDFIYSPTSQGEFVCLDARTGERVWATDKVTARKTGPSAHITPNGDAAFLFTDEGNLINARLTPAGYEEISRTHLIEPTYLFGGHKLVWAPPAYANRCIFVRNEREILCTSLAAGEERSPK